jgi:small subunit ribosomal protein S4
VLESRLDNVVYRLGFADSRRQARQLVRHGHFALNGRRTDIPSALVKAGDTISVMPKARQLEYFKIAQEGLARKSVPTWLTLDVSNMSGQVVTLPGRDEIEVAINEQLVVEFYSR